MSLRFAGYAALFGTRDSGRDVIRPGAFAATLASRKEPLPLFWQHRPDMRIGWVESIAEDAKGLRVIAGIDNPEGGAALALKAGKANGLSFGYRARGFQRDAAGRELTEIDLFEVSLVSHPMQHTARVHLVDAPAEQKFNQRHLRENGQFAHVGEGVLYGSVGAGTAQVSHVRRNTASTTSAIRAEPSGASANSSRPLQRNTRNAATSAMQRASTERQQAERNLQNIRQTFGTAPAPRLRISERDRRPHYDLTPGDSAASFALRQVGTGTYQQLDRNPHAVGRRQNWLQGSLSLKCNAMVNDSLNWAGAAPPRMQGGRIPVANEWGNPRVEIGYYPVVGSYTVPSTGLNDQIIGQLREGDVISNGRHVALVTMRFGFPQSVSAVPAAQANLPVLGGVVRNDWGFRASQRIVIRRFSRNR